MMTLILAANLVFPAPLPSEKAVSEMLSHVKVPPGYYVWDIVTATQSFSFDNKQRAKLGLNGKSQGDIVVGKLELGSWPKGAPRNSRKGYPGLFTVRVALYSSSDGAETQSLWDAKGYDRQSLTAYPKGTISGHSVRAKAWHFWDPAGPPASLMLQAENVYITATFQPDASVQEKGAGFRAMTDDDAKMIDECAIATLNLALKLGK